MQQHLLQKNSTTSSMQGSTSVIMQPVTTFQAAMTNTQSVQNQTQKSEGSQSKRMPVEITQQEEQRIATRDSAEREQR
jgi:ribosomal protein S7